MQKCANRKRNLALWLAFCLLTCAFVAIGEGESGATPSLLTALAADAHTAIAQMTFDVQPADSVLDAAIEAALAHPECIRPSQTAGMYDFPLLEVERTPLVWQAALWQRTRAEKCYLISLFPEGVPQMAACVVLDEHLSVVEVFPGSTWGMQQHWEKALASPEYFWSVEMRYLFHRLFEPRDMWHAAALPGDASISAETAVQLANQALADRLPGDMEAYYVVIQYNASKQYDTKGSEIWSVLYYTSQHEGASLLWSVDMDARTGEILGIKSNQQSNG